MADETSQCVTAFLELVVFATNVCNETSPYCGRRLCFIHLLFSFQKPENFCYQYVLTIQYIQCHAMWTLAVVCCRYSCGPVWLILCARNRSDLISNRMSRYEAAGNEVLVRLHHYKLPVSRMAFIFMDSIWVPSYQHGLVNYIPYKVCDEITFTSPNFNGEAVEIWEWISNLIPSFTGQVNGYPCWD